MDVFRSEILERPVGGEGEIEGKKLKSSER